MEAPTTGISWVDVFPWIENARQEFFEPAEAPEIDRRWRDAIDPEDPLVRDMSVAVTESAFDLLAKEWTIAEVFPLLRGSTRIREMGLANRTANRLNRAGCMVAEDLAQMGLRDLLDIRALGLGTVNDIISALVLMNIRTAAQSDVDEFQRFVGSVDKMGERTSQPWEHDVISGVVEMAKLNVLIGRPDERILDVRSAIVKVPGDGVTISKLCARDVLSDGQLKFDLAKLLDELLSQYDDRAQLILRSRFFADDEVTLEALGAELGVTRERVRQIESRARSQLGNTLDPGGSLAVVGSAIRDGIGTIRQLSDLLDEFPSLAAEVHLAQKPTWRVIDRIDDDYEIVDGWCCSPSLSAVAELTFARLEELADEHGLVDPTFNPAWFPDAEYASVPSELAEAWADYLGIPRYRGILLTRSSGLTDWAIAILAVERRPMTMEELQAEIPLERSVNSLRNALGSDARIVRVDRSKWALAEWDLQEYLGIRELIRAELQRAGGSASVEQIVTRISGSYDVNAGSVRTYASSAPFVINDGMVAEVAVSQHTRGRKSVASTKHLYVQDEGLALRVRVNKDHLRGSGFPLPVALVNAFDLEPGSTVEFSTARGPILMRWSGLQPSMSSIRQFLVELDCSIGDDVFCKFGSDRTFSVEQVEPLESPDSINRVAAMIGCEMTGDPIRDVATLARAIGLPGNSSVAGVIGALQDRGESDLVELLVSGGTSLQDSTSQVPTDNARVEEIMDLL